MNMDYDLVSYRRQQMKENGVTEELVDSVSKFDFDYLIEAAMDMRIPREVLHDLVELLHEIYNQEGKIFINDSKYDLLYEMNKRLNGTEFSSESYGKGRKVKHKYPQLRGTVGKVHYIRSSDKPLINGKYDPRRSYEQFIAGVEHEMERPIDGIPARLSLKVDGVSGVVELEDGVSKQVLKRGDTVGDEAYGQEILILKNRLFGGLKDKAREMGVKVEVFMNREDFAKYTKKYGKYDTPRSAIVSIVNRDDFDEENLQYVSIYDIEYWVNGKRELPENEEFVMYVDDCKNYDEIEQKIQRIQYNGQQAGVPADGVVIRLMNEELINVMGREDAVNNFEIAYKFPMEKHKAILKDVNFSMGLGGSITPVAEIIPIDINGVTITNISVGSIPRLLELDLRRGQDVLITHDVIPYLYDYPATKDEFKDKIEIPIRCPKCDHELSYEKSKLFCTNYHCDGMKAGRILNYIQKMDIQDISYSTVDRLIEFDLIDNIVDLYKLGAKDLSVIPGFGSKTINNILQQIDSKRVVGLDTFLGSLGIPNVGRKMFKKIILNIGEDSLMEMFETEDYSELFDIKGVGKSTVEAIENWISNPNNRAVMKKLLKDFISIKPMNRTVNSHTILFTKIRDKEFQEFLEEAGYGIADNYSKNVDVVIYGGESSKTQKAKKDGKMLLTLPQAYEIYGYNNK